MNPVHWLRTRQEERELTYWLALVAYDRQDRTLNNRLYLVYLILFFGVWVFITLTLFASGGAVFLELVRPGDPASAAVLLETLLLGAWFLFGLRQALRRSPLVFSEQDAVLICQTPVSRRQVALRWLAMPWLKSAVPFWLAAVVLGFSLAELAVPGEISTGRLIEYAGYGLRAWLPVLPVQLGLYALQWAVGIFRLQQDKERHGLALPVMATALAVSVFLVLPLLRPAAHAWSAAAQSILFPLRAGFGTGSVMAAVTGGGIFALLALGAVGWISGSFSLSRAAQETQEIEALNSAMQYGFSGYAEELKTRQRLGVTRAPTRLPAAAGAAVLAWKDILQSQRGFRLAALLGWLALFGTMAGVGFLPDTGSLLLALAFWAIQIGRIAVIRLRSDLACWPLSRQLPISHRSFVLFNLGPAALLAVILSLAGLAVGSWIARPAVGSLAALVPGMTAAVAGIAALDVIRQARINLLFNGSVPEISAGGILGGLVFAFLPLLVQYLLPGPAGILLSIPASLLLGAAALALAVNFYRNLGSS